MKTCSGSTAKELMRSTTAKHKVTERQKEGSAYTQKGDFFKKIYTHAVTTKIMLSKLPTPLNLPLCNHLLPVPLLKPSARILTSSDNQKTTELLDRKI